jgi:hypothetical protein
MLSKKATKEVRAKQLEWNKGLNCTTNPIASSSRVVLDYLKTIELIDSSDCESLNCPVLIIGAEADKVTPPSHCERLHEWVLDSDSPHSRMEIISGAAHNIIYEEPDIVNALIYNFLVTDCDLDPFNIEAGLEAERNDPKWSLKYPSVSLTVRNMDKWLSIDPVSPNVFNFRPCKTLRHMDKTHSPELLITHNPRIGLLVDLSGGDIAYRPSDLGKNCIYKKLATVSKTPPTPEQTDVFVDIVTRYWRLHPDAEIAVHCHYGFNRTGFFICQYLVEKGMSVGDALDAFEAVRPPGM